MAVEEGEGEVRLVHGCTAAPSPRRRPVSGLVKGLRRKRQLHQKASCRVNYILVRLAYGCQRTRDVVCALMQQLLWAPLLKLPGELQTWKRGKKGTLIGPEKRDLRETWLLDLARHTSAGLYAGFLLVFRQRRTRRRRDQDRGERVSGRAGTGRLAPVEFRALPYAS